MSPLHPPALYFSACRSPVHQVVTTGVERTSFVFFYYPNFDAKLPAASHGSSPPGSSGAAAEAAAASGAAAAVAESVGTGAESPASVGRTTTVGDGGGGGGVGEAASRGKEDTAARATVVRAAAKTPGKGEIPASIGSYNTLLDLKRGDAGTSSGGVGGPAVGDAADESFGQYLLRKWGAVFRE